MHTLSKICLGQFDFLHNRPIQMRDPPQFKKKSREVLQHPPARTAFEATDSITPAGGGKR